MTRTVGIVGDRAAVARFVATDEGKAAARDIAASIFASPDALAAFEGGELLDLPPAISAPVEQHLHTWITQRNQRWDAEEGTDIA